MFKTNVYLTFVFLAALSVKLGKRFNTDQLHMNIVVLHETVHRSSTRNYTPFNLYEVDRLSSYSVCLKTNRKQKIKGNTHQWRTEGEGLGFNPPPPPPAEILKF
jgi:hypothetical protein